MVVQRCSGRATMGRLTLAVLSLVSLLCIIPSCVAQRTATSLGMKQNKQQPPSTSTSFRAGEFLEDIKPDLYSFTVLVGIWVIIMAWKYMGEEGESSLSLRKRLLLFLGLVRPDYMSLTSSLLCLLYYVDDMTVDSEDLQTLRKDIPMDLAFEQVRMELKQKRNGKRVLLDGSIRGRCQPGRMLAIMGPSGSGKSSLLHALAGKVKYSPKLSLEGKRYLNGHEIQGMLPAALIEQDVSFFPHMTVRETLEFRVDLLLGRTIPKSERAEFVQDLINQLNLQKAADTIVGNLKIRGISGGERKRLSIACEMISSPSLILLDEPTSGLDSNQALQVIETLRNLADSGKTVVVVIHQPNQHVFSLFDDLLLLSEGKQMYYGEINKVRGYMANLGYKAPNEMGTAEHVLDCISLDMDEQGDPLQESEDRLDNLATKARAEEINLGIDQKDHSIEVVHERRGPKASLIRQFQLLLNRAVRETFRGKGAILIKAVQQITLGIVYGGIYHLGVNQVRPYSMGCLLLL